MQKDIMSLANEEPNLTQSEVAERLGISRQRVSQVCKKLGLKFSRGSRGPSRKRGIVPIPKDKNRFGFSRNRRNASLIGAAAEMIVCSYLLQRGHPVYKALSPSSPCDLVADLDGKLFRVEVKSASRNLNGGISYPRPDAAKYDLLGLVFQDASVVFLGAPGTDIPEI